MKRSSLLFFLVLMVHLSLVAAAVTFSVEPQAKAVEKAIEGVIIPAPAAPQPEKPKPKAIQPEPEKKPEQKPPQPKQAAAKKVATEPKPAPIKPVPVAVASPKAISAPETVAEAEKAGAVAKISKPEPQATPPVASASKAVNKAPLYPMLSRRLKEQGTVYLQVLVLKNGKVGQLTLKQSSGFSRLDQSALNAVRHWTYQPALKLGQPVDYWFVQPVIFNLNSIH